MSKTIIVCGGSKGIGAATVLVLLAQKYKVVILARTKGELRSKILKNPNVTFIKVDFSDSKSRAQVIKKISKISDLYGLVNNSSGPQTGRLTNTHYTEFLPAFETHLFTTVELVNTIVPKLILQGGGRIVNIISVTAKIPLENLGVSNTLRGAMLNWAKTLSKELGPNNITVNSVLPGYTDTERLREVIDSNARVSGMNYQEQANRIISQIPMKRFANPKEIAEVVAFLLSNKSSYVNGAAIPVDGGWTPCS